MADADAMRRELARVRRWDIRRQMIEYACAVYGQEKVWVDTDTIAERVNGGDMSPEFQYLKDLGYLKERERDDDGKRWFQATAKGYALWCGEIEDRNAFN